MFMEALSIGLIITLLSPPRISVAFLSQWKSQSEGISLPAELV